MNDLLYPAVAHTDDGGYLAVTEARCAGFADRSGGGRRWRAFAGKATLSGAPFADGRIDVVWGDHLGWVVKRDGLWHAYVADPKPGADGHLVGRFMTRREAIDEVYIERRVAL